MWRHSLLSLTLVLLGTICAIAAPLEELTPYEVDPYTLHLWHLDEGRPPFRDDGPSPTPLLGLHNGAKVKQPAYKGLGHSISFNHHIGGEPGKWTLQGAILAEAPSLADGPDDRMPKSLRYQGGNGAFTYEALVKLDLQPSEAKVIALAIISMDGEEDERIFNFRIERQGFLTFTPLSDSGAKGGAIASLPLTGPHALNTTDWFHVAVTYSGREDSPNNLNLYWTRIGSETTTANRIGTGKLSHDFTRFHRGDFAIGNEARAAHNANAEAEPFPGCIDEVRISSVARHPSDFIFIPPNLRRSPSTANADQMTAIQNSPLKLGLAEMTVDGKKTSLPSQSGQTLTLPPGLHQLDFDLSFSSEQMTRPVKLLTQLDGMDDTWRSSPLGRAIGLKGF